MEVSESTVNRTAAGAHAAVDTLAAAGNQAASRVKPAIDRVTAMAHNAVDTAAGAVTPAAEWLNEQGESFNALQKKVVDDTCSYISANPLKSVPNPTPPFPPICSTA